MSCSIVSITLAAHTISAVRKNWCWSRWYHTSCRFC